MKALLISESLTDVGPARPAALRCAALTALCLAQMVAAFSLAMLLNRTLVMPKFVCFCDRFW